MKEILKNIKLNESLISILFGGIVLILVTILFFTQTQADKTPRLTSSPTIAIADVANDIAAPVTQADNNAETTYTVSAGDSMWSIAEKKYGSGFEWVKIAAANPDIDPNVLTEGEKLVLPKDGEISESAAATETATPKPTAQTQTTTSPTEIPSDVQNVQPNNYVVVRGDNLWNIAVATYGDGFRWTEIAQINHLANPNIIHAGNVLQLPK